MIHPLRVGDLHEGRVVGRLRATIYSNGKVDYQAKRLSILDKAQFVRALRGILAKIEREQLTRIYGPTGETLTAEAKLGDLT